MHHQSQLGGGVRAVLDTKKDPNLGLPRLALLRFQMVWGYRTRNTSLWSGSREMLNNRGACGVLVRGVT